MKVKKTLGELAAELEELKELRNREAQLLANCMTTNREKFAKGILEEYKYYDKLIKELSKLEIEYEVSINR